MIITIIINHSCYPFFLSNFYAPSGQLKEGARKRLLLTITRLNFFEGQLGPRLADQHLPIEREHDVVFDKVYHAADHVAWLPCPAKRFTAHMPALALKIKQQGGISANRQQDRKELDRGLDEEGPTAAFRGICS